jgi:arsenate reductase
MITLFHNPRCRKSREGLALIEQSGKAFKVLKYLENPPNFEELTTLITKLQLKPIALVRQKERIWIEHFKGKTLTDVDVIKPLVAHPILIERPIIIEGNKAIIGRPIEKIIRFLS